jgi:hypothetical protein
MNEYKVNMDINWTIMIMNGLIASAALSLSIARGSWRSMVMPIILLVNSYVSYAVGSNTVFCNNELKTLRTLYSYSGSSPFRQYAHLMLSNFNIRFDYSLFLTSLITMANLVIGCAQELGMLTSTWSTMVISIIDAVVCASFTKMLWLRARVNARYFSWLYCSTHDNLSMAADDDKQHYTVDIDADSVNCNTIKPDVTPTIITPESSDVIGDNHTPPAIPMIPGLSPADQHIVDTVTQQYERYTQLIQAGDYANAALIEEQSSGQMLDFIKIVNQSTQHILNEHTTSPVNQ